MIKKYLFLFLLICFSLIIFLKENILYYHFKPTATMFSSMEYFKKQSSVAKKDYLVIGDGAIFTALSPKIFSNNSFSHAMSANSLMDMYFLLKKTDLTQVKKGIILSNSFFYEKHYESDFWDVIIPVGYYNLSELKEIYNIGRDNKIFPFVKYGEVHFWFKAFYSYLFLNTEIIDAFESALTEFNYIESYKVKIDKRLEKFNGYTYLTDSQKPTRFYYSYRLHFNKFFYPNPTDDYYLKQILILLKNKKVYFVKTPLAKDSHKKIKVEKFEDGLKNYMASLKSEFSNLEYLNLDQNLTLENFYNFYNLNIDGSKIFSKNAKKLISH